MFWTFILMKISHFFMVFAWKSTIFHPKIPQVIPNILPYGCEKSRFLGFTVSAPPEATGGFADSEILCREKGEPLRKSSGEGVKGGRSLPLENEVRGVLEVKMSRFWWVNRKTLTIHYTLRFLEISQNCSNPNEQVPKIRRQLGFPRLSVS